MDGWVIEEGVNEGWNENNDPDGRGKESICGEKWIDQEYTVWIG